MIGKTTAQRGYGADHDRLRARWAPIVKRGGVNCWRCKQPIAPNDPWDLGHNDDDRTKYEGPECIPCNRGEPSRRRTTTTPPSRKW